LKKILNNTGIQKKIICFTGATGFVGSKLLDKLIEIGCNIKVLTRNKNARLSKNIKTYVGDLADQNCNLSAFIKDCDIFFNCAGEKNNHTKMRSLHVNGTQNLLNNLRHEAVISNKKIHWIQLSSCGAYGSPPKENFEVRRIITESSETKPTNEYERTKTESDELVIKASADQLILYTILRPSNIIANIGKDTSINKLIKLLNLGFFFFIGKKDAIATYVHLDDVVNALVEIACNPNSKNEIFNLSSDCSWESLIQEILKKKKVKVLPIRIPYKLLKLPLIFLRFLIGRFIHIPLFSALVMRTSYPSLKIEKNLNFKFVMPMPYSIKYLINIEGKNKTEKK